MTAFELSGFGTGRIVTRASLSGEFWNLEFQIKSPLASRIAGARQTMDPKAKDPLWYAQQLVDALRSEVAAKEKELALLIAHKAVLMKAFSTPTFPPGYIPSGPLRLEHYDRLQDRTDPRPSSTPDAADPSAKRTGASKPAKKGGAGKSAKGIGTSKSAKEKGAAKCAKAKRARVPEHYDRLQDLTDPRPSSPPDAADPSAKRTGASKPAKKGGAGKSAKGIGTSKSAKEKGAAKCAKAKRARVPAVLAKQDTPPRRISPPLDPNRSELEPSDDSYGPPKSQHRTRPSRAENATDTALKHIFFHSSGSGNSSDSSEDKTEGPLTKGPNFPVVNWTDQITRRPTTVLHGDISSSDTDDSVFGKASADQCRSNFVRPANSGKNVKSEAGLAKAASQASSLSSDAPPEDLFDWEVLGLSGPWLLEESSSLPAGSSWSQQKQQSLLPCKFETIDEYRSSFESLIFEECKAHITSSWEMQKSPSIGTSQKSSEIEGVLEDTGQSSSWQFRLMYPSTGDPFNYVEAEQCTKYGELVIRLDPCELVVLIHNDTTSMAIVTLTNNKSVLLRTRIKLQVSGGQCTLIRLASMVTLKRQYVSLLKTSEISDPLLQQLLDPQKNSNFVINPPSESCLEENVRVTSCHGTVLTWKTERKFNNKQLVTMEALLQLKQGFLLVQGPPGTGKTSTIVGMVSAIHIEEPRSRILVCASSNAAIDEIVSRLMYHMLDEAGNSYMPKRGTLLRLGVQTSICPACRPVSLDNILQGNAMASKSSKARTEVVAEASIVCCTISSSGNQIFDEFNQKFDLLIIDESAQALECEVLIALQRVKSRCVMVGDPCQLPAVVIQRPGTAYGRSLFERMQEAGRPSFMMTTQYRMHPYISQFPSAQFYGGHLKDSSQSQSMQPIFMDKAQEMGIDLCGYNFRLGAYFFLDVRWGVEQAELVGHSLSNIDEAAVVATVVQGVVRSLRRGIEPNIGVITPYLAQCSAIMEKLDQCGVDERACEVNTVDGFQGREKDIIILSCVRAQTEHGLGFVSDVRRMNVALTRARHSLIIVGHALTLRSQSQAWNALVEDAYNRQLYQILCQKSNMATIDDTRHKIASDRKCYTPGPWQHSIGRSLSKEALRQPQGPANDQEGHQNSAQEGIAATAGTGPRSSHKWGQKWKGQQNGTREGTTPTTGTGRQPSHTGGHKLKGQQNDTREGTAATARKGHNQFIHGTRNGQDSRIALKKVMQVYTAGRGPQPSHTGSLKMKAEHDGDQRESKNGSPGVWYCSTSKCGFDNNRYTKYRHRCWGSSGGGGGCGGGGSP